MKLSGFGPGSGAMYGDGLTVVVVTGGAVTSGMVGVGRVVVVDCAGGAVVEVGTAVVVVGATVVVVGAMVVLADVVLDDVVG